MFFLSLPSLLFFMSLVSVLSLLFLTFLLSLLSLLWWTEVWKLANKYEVLVNDADNVSGESDVNIEDDGYVNIDDDVNCKCGRWWLCKWWKTMPATLHLVGGCCIAPRPHSPALTQDHHCLLHSYCPPPPPFRPPRPVDIMFRLPQKNLLDLAKIKHDCILFTYFAPPPSKEKYRYVCFIWQSYCP